MSLSEGPVHRVSVPQLNSDLEKAQLELLSAAGAVHQLRLHYSYDEVARFGRRDVLQKSAEAACDLHQFYAAIECKRPSAGSELISPSPEQIRQAVGWLASYLREQRGRYLPVASELTPRQKAAMWPYFSPALLDQVRIIELFGARVPLPDFFEEVRSLGFDPPEITHMDSVTFLDIIAFNEQFSERALFHGLVHFVQIQLLGLERYAELWVNSFIRTRMHFTVPLEVHAFSMASKFIRPIPERFSVEEEVQNWIDRDRY